MTDTGDNTWTPSASDTWEATGTGTWSGEDTWTGTVTSWKATGTGTRSGKATGSATGGQKVYSGTTGAWVSGTFVKGATYAGPVLTPASGLASGSRSLLLPTGSGALNIPGTNVTGNMTIPFGTAILPPGVTNSTLPGNTPVTSPSVSPSPSPSPAQTPHNSGALRKREITKKTQYGLVFGAAGGMVLAGTLL